jgi:hypothetical protein
MPRRPLFTPHQGDGNMLEILITSFDYKLPTNSAFLFSNLTVPDVISWIEDGDCGFCKDQNIFPGCTNGRSEKFRMGCGVQLACPLYIGIDYSREHKEFLERYNWESAPEDEQNSMDDWLRERMDELGYPMWKK